MSLSASGQETHRAVAGVTLPLGGQNADIQQIQATEDREIVGVQWAKAAGAALLGVSFGSGFSLGTGVDNAKNAAVAQCGDFTGMVEFDTPVQWSAGEEIHLHSRNNTGGDVYATVLIHYREV